MSVFEVCGLTHAIIVIIIIINVTNIMSVIIKLFTRIEYASSADWKYHIKMKCYVHSFIIYHKNHSILKWQSSRPSIYCINPTLKAGVMNPFPNSVCTVTAKLKGQSIEGWRKAVTPAVYQSRQWGQRCAEAQSLLPNATLRPWPVHCEIM